MIADLSHFSRLALSRPPGRQGGKNRTGPHFRDVRHKIFRPQTTYCPPRLAKSPLAFTARCGLLQTFERNGEWVAMVAAFPRYTTTTAGITAASRFAKHTAARCKTYLCARIVICSAHRRAHWRCNDHWRGRSRAVASRAKRAVGFACTRAVQCGHGALHPSRQKRRKHLVCDSG